jgi:hypothetical protein
MAVDPSLPAVLPAQVLAKQQLAASLLRWALMTITGCLVDLQLAGRLHPGLAHLWHLLPWHRGGQKRAGGAGRGAHA